MTHNDQQMRIACIANIAPGKVGSFERWMLALAQDAKTRQYKLDFFTWDSIHPEVALGLARQGAGRHTIEWLYEHPMRAIISFIRDYDIVHIHLFAPRSLVGLLAWLSWPTKVVFVDRFSAPAEETHDRRSQLRPVLDRLTVCRFAALVAISEDVANRNRQRFRIDSKRMRTIYNGVDLERFGSQARVSAPSNYLHITIVANLIKEKGVDCVIRAIASLSDPRILLYVVGTGPEHQTLHKLASELGIHHNVVFLGQRDDVPDILGTTDIFVHAATWKEAFGLTIAEAMASGIAVAGSQIGAIGELIIDGQSGLLFEPGNANQLAHKLHILANNERFRLGLGDEARKRARSHFGLDQCVRKHLNLCEEVLGVYPVPGAAAADDRTTWEP